jgi:hypothetical protein
VDSYVEIMLRPRFRGCFGFLVDGSLAPSLENIALSRDMQNLLTTVVMYMPKLELSVKEGYPNPDRCGRISQDDHAVGIMTKYRTQKDVLCNLIWLNLYTSA